MTLILTIFLMSCGGGEEKKDEKKKVLLKKQTTEQKATPIAENVPASKKIDLTNKGI